MPTPYTPPLARRAQAVKSGRFRKRLAAVESARRRIPPRWRWLVPLAGLLPILVAVVLASEGVRLGGPSGQPVATGALAASTTGAAKPAVSGVPLGPTPIAGLAGSAQTGAGAGATSNGTSTIALGGTTTGGGTPAGSGTTAGGSSTAGSGTTTGAGTTAASGFRAYAVQPGDTVKFVAQMYGVSAASISQASGLQNPDVLRVGQVLTIPAQPGWLYRVQPGENLDQIAARTGVATAIIASASNLTTDAVRPGDVILIPDQAGAISK